MESWKHNQQASRPLSRVRLRPIIIGNKIKGHPNLAPSNIWWFYHLWKAETMHHLLADTIWFCWFSPLFPNSWDSQTERDRRPRLFCITSNRNIHKWMNMVVNMYLWFMTLKLCFISKLRVPNCVVHLLSISPGPTILKNNTAQECITTQHKTFLRLKSILQKKKERTSLLSVLSKRTTRPPRSPVARWSPLLSNSMAEMMSTGTNVCKQNRYIKNSSLNCRS